MRKLFYFALTAVLTLGALNSCKKDDAPAAEPEGVVLTGGSANQTVWADENTGTGTVKFETTGAWTSSISVAPGTRAEAAAWVTISPASGSAAGDYTITITLADNYTGADRTAVITIASGGDTITITVTQKGTDENGETLVEQVPVTGLSLNRADTVLTVGETAALTAAIAPQDATNQDVTWSSDNEEVATVDQTGTITALTPGTATITAVSAENEEIKDECAVTVTAKTIPVESVSIDYSGSLMVLTAGEAYQLTATVSPENATDKTVVWSSSAPEVAAVDQTGRVTALKTGEVTITAAAGDKTADLNVVVLPPFSASVSFDKSSYTVAVGETIVISGTYAPANALQGMSVESWRICNTCYTAEYRGAENGTFSFAVTGGTVGKHVMFYFLYKGTEHEISATCTVTVVSGEPGVTIAGIEWAKRNVGEPGKFVENPWDYGGYFTFDEAQTACPAGWRTPTTAEHQSLANSGSTWTTENNINGRRFGSGGNTIFLPAAGVNGIVFSGLAGYYWSSTVDSPFFDYLILDGSDAHLSGNDNSTLRHSVRCVRE